MDVSAILALAPPGPVEFRVARYENGQCFATLHVMGAPWFQTSTGETPEAAITALRAKIKPAPQSDIDDLI